MTIGEGDKLTGCGRENFHQIHSVASRVAEAVLTCY